jgi:hypothetical protein
VRDLFRTRRVQPLLTNRQLDARRKVNAPGVLDVQHTTWPVVARFRRSVYCQRAHRYDTASRHHTIDSLNFCSERRGDSVSAYRPTARRGIVAAAPPR